MYSFCVVCLYSISFVTLTFSYFIAAPTSVVVIFTLLVLSSRTDYYYYYYLFISSIDAIVQSNLSNNVM
jgi:hypothetical protein